MFRLLIILVALIAAAGVFLLGPFVSFGALRPFEPLPVRVVISGVLVLVAAGLALGAINRRKRLQAQKSRLSTRAAFRATWRMVGMLSAPIAVLAGLSIWVIERSYRDISELTGEMSATLDDLDQLDRTRTLSDIASTTAVLTRVYRFTRRGEGGMNLPLLDPETDRAYLVDHYELMVSNHLRPHLMRRLEDQITSNLGKADALYSALKVYLMLGQEGPMDADYVLSWLEADLVERFPGAYNQTLREELILHTGTLIGSGRWNEYPVRGDLVAEARAQLAEIEPGQLLYYRITSDPVISTLDGWRVSEAGGPATSRVFRRASGASLDEAIPGIFTHEGFQLVFLPLALRSADLLEREAWVLDSAFRPDPGGNDASRMIRQVLDLYYAEFIAQWDWMLRDLTLIPMSSRTQLVEVLNIVSGPTSPIRNVLKAAADETRLTAKVEREIFDNSTQAARTQSSSISRMGRLSRLIEDRDPLDDLTVAPGAEVEERFGWLHDLFRGSPPEIDTYLAQLAETHAAMNWVDPSGNAMSVIIERAAADLEAMRPTLPPVLDNWTLQLLGALDGQTAEATRATVNAKWQSEILPFCRRATEGRYPFDRDSPVDVPLGDFARMFAPGGIIDTYFNEYLAPFVDRGARQWRWRAEIGLSDSSLAMFRDAAEIRDAFFRGGGQPDISFRLSVLALDPEANYLAVQLGDDRHVYSHGPQTAEPYRWPWQVPTANLELGVDGQAHFLREDGDWAFFRLLDRLQMQRQDAKDAVRFAANIEGKLGMIEIRFASAINPFSVDALSDFTCPRGL